MKKKKNIYKFIREYDKEFNKKEREKYKLINDYNVGDNVNIKYKNKIYNGIIKKVNIKTYTIIFNIDEKVLIDKISLVGYPESIIKDISGDGRRYIGESCRLLKEIEE